MNAKLIDLPAIRDTRGNLSFAENMSQVPFEIKRAYWLYDVPGGESRGSHAHKTLDEILVAASGSFRVTLDDGREKKSFFLNRPYQALYVPRGLWRDLEEFSSGAVCLALANELYDPDDYIRDYDEFLKYKSSL